MSIYRGRVVRPKPINIKPIPIPKRRISRRLSTPMKCTMKGGPMHGGWRYTRTFVDSLVITVRGQTGYYMVNGRWVPCNERGEPTATREEIDIRDRNKI